MNSKWKSLIALSVGASFMVGVIGCGGGTNPSADTNGQQFKSNEEASAAYRSKPGGGVGGGGSSKMQEEMAAKYRARPQGQ